MAPVKLFLSLLALNVSRRNCLRRHTVKKKNMPIIYRNKKYD
jgi:hypothetical protein